LLHRGFLNLRRLRHLRIHLIKTPSSAFYTMRGRYLRLPDRRARNFIARTLVLPGAASLSPAKIPVAARIALPHQNATSWQQMIASNGGRHPKRTRQSADRHKVSAEKRCECENRTPSWTVPKRYEDQWPSGVRTPNQLSRT